jgi:hypothetical protein
MYCSQCGLKNRYAENYCFSCGESLNEGLYHIKKEKHIEIMFFIIMSLGCVLLFSNHQFYSELVVFTIIPLALYKFFSSKKFTSTEFSSKFCPKCQHSNFNKNYCIKCGYNLKNVLGYVKTDRYDIEMNKNYINIYPKKYFEHNDGASSRFSAKTFELAKIEKIRISSCKKLISSGQCFKFNYLDTDCKKLPYLKKQEDKCIVQIDLSKRNIEEFDRILSSGFYGAK